VKHPRCPRCEKAIIGKSGYVKTVKHCKYCTAILMKEPTREYYNKTKRMKYANKIT